MQQKHRERWELEIRRQNGPMKKPTDLLKRIMSSEDFVDCAVIGGVSVADILAGKVDEWQIHRDVIEAYHAQYPIQAEAMSFTEKVQSFHGDSRQIMGFVNGVKGKLFEIHQLDWLNDHLPAGYTVALAHDANNPAWDIAIRNSQGHIDNVLQAKATASASYVQEALNAHPDIDIITTNELYNKLANSSDWADHIANGHEGLGSLDHQLDAAVGHAQDAGAVHFPIFGPALVIGIAVLHNSKRYKQGNITFENAIKNVGERGALAGLAAGAGWVTVQGLAWILNGGPHVIVGLPVSIAVRLFGGQFLHNRDRKAQLSSLVESLQKSRFALKEQLPRPLLTT